MNSEPQKRQNNENKTKQGHAFNHKKWRLNVSRHSL
nr:MAG TPA: hypothetical protein [Caudoviricetes sp.]